MCARWRNQGFFTVIHWLWNTLETIIVSGNTKVPVCHDNPGNSTRWVTILGRPDRVVVVCVGKMFA